MSTTWLVLLWVPIDRGRPKQTCLLVLVRVVFLSTHSPAFSSSLSLSLSRFDAPSSQEVCVSGDLAPFDEVSVAFRGPLNLYNIAWYEGTADDTLERTTAWTKGYVSFDSSCNTPRCGFYCRWFGCPRNSEKNCSSYVFLHAV